MKKHWAAIKQFIQFNIVGLMNTAVDFVIYTMLTALFHIQYIPAKMVSYSCGVINSYFFNSRWTFKAQKKRTRQEFLLFVLVNLVSFGVSLGIMYACRNYFGIESDFLCNVIATPVSIVINFAGNRLFVFRDASREEDAPEP